MYTAYNDATTDPCYEEQFVRVSAYLMMPIMNVPIESSKGNKIASLQVEGLDPEALQGPAETMVSSGDEYAQIAPQAS